MNPTFYVILICIFSCFNTQSVAHTALQGTILNTTLPSPLIGHSVIYDESDSIYILGGFNKDNKSHVLHFNITTSIITTIGELPGVSVSGQVEMDQNGNIFYFGGGVNNTDIYRYRTKDNNCETVARSDPGGFSSSIKYNQSHVILFSRAENGCGSLFYYDLNTGEAKYLTMQTPSAQPYYSFGGSHRVILIRNACDGLGVRIGNEIFIFASNSYDYIEVVDLETFDAETITKFGIRVVGVVSASTDGRYIYIVRGGYSYERNKLVKFDTVNRSYSSVTVEGITIGFLKEGSNYYPATAFVEKLNRIYFFNAIANRSGEFIRNEVGYIQLEMDASIESDTTDYPNLHISTILQSNISATTIDNAQINSSTSTSEIYDNATISFDNKEVKKLNSTLSKSNEKSGNDITSDVKKNPFGYRFWITTAFVPLFIVAMAFVTCYVIRRLRARKLSSACGKDELEMIQREPIGLIRTTPDEQTERYSPFTIQKHKKNKINMECESPEPDNRFASPQTKNRIKLLQIRPRNTRNLVWKSLQPFVLLSQDVIGDGGFAKVYKAKHSLHSNLHFAIKKVPIYKSLQQLDWKIEKVLREVENLAKILNPNVVRLWNCWMEDPNGNIVSEDAKEKFRLHEWTSTMDDYFMFLQMELCDYTLRDWLITNNSLEQRMSQNVKGIMSQIVNGLRGIHSLGIIHRDIKPNNIFYCENGNLWKIGDLGLSVETADFGEEHTVTGCELYRSPENDADDGKCRTSKYNSKTDVFSLGLSFLEIICVFGNQSIKMKTFHLIRNRCEKMSLQAIAKIEPIVEISLVELVSKMLAKCPSDRIDIFDSLFDTLFCYNE